MRDAASFVRCYTGTRDRRDRTDPAALLELIQRIKTASNTPAFPPKPAVNRPLPLARAG